MNTVDEAITNSIEAEPPAEVKAVLEEFLTAMHRFDEKAKQDWEEIERLKAETRANLARLREAA